MNPPSSALPSEPVQERTRTVDPANDPRKRRHLTRYYSAEEAYKIVSRLPLVAVKLVALGEYPEYYDHGLAENVVAADYPEELGDPPMQMVRAAKEFLSACDKGTPKEINDRSDGPVTQKLDVAGTALVKLMAGVAAPPAAFRTAEEARAELFGATPE